MGGTIVTISCSSSTDTRRSGTNTGGGAGAGGISLTGGNGGSGGGGGSDISVDDDGGTPTPTTPFTHDDTPFVKDDTGGAGLDGPTIDQLKKGGSSCSATVVYPYDQTMFPAGGLAPIVQWKGASDAAYVKMTYGDLAYVSYEYAVGASNPGRIQIPADAWDQVSRRTTPPPAKLQPLQITLTTKTGGNLSTCSLSWLVAPGVLSGNLYYNSYDDPGVSKVIPPGGGDEGAVLRLKLGATSPDPFIYNIGRATPGFGPCYGCHSVSARGAIMEANRSDYSMNKSFETFIYDISSNPAPPVPPVSQKSITAATYGALTPDGSALLTMGNPQCTSGADTYPRAPENFPTVEGPAIAKLWDTKTLQPIAANGLNPDWYMWMPNFSPNGDKVVFNHGKKGPNGRSDRRELATMDYDAASHTFSNLQVIYHDDGPAPSLPYVGYTETTGAGSIPTGADGCTVGGYGPAKAPWANQTFNDTCSDLCYPGWPFFTPDGKKVVFARGTEPDFASWAPGLRSGTASSISRLFIIDLATKKVHALDNANGMKPDGTPSIPDGPWGKEINYEFFPTVMPISIGGQFWLFWSSRRSYGNFPQRTAPKTDLDKSGQGVDNKDAKKIWVSAIDIDAPPDVDPSHPGFFLQGQGDAGNMRAFPTLAVCKGDSQTCASGIDCCSGYCIDGMCGAQPPMMCAKTQDKCTDAADCCDKTQRCYGGFCAVPPPPK